MKRKLKQGDIVRITAVSNPWKFAEKELIGAIVEVVEASHSMAQPDNLVIVDVKPLTSLPPAFSKQFYIGIKYKHLPKYATEHFKQEIDHEIHN